MHSHTCQLQDYASKTKKKILFALEMIILEQFLMKHTLRTLEINVVKL